MIYINCSPVGARCREETPPAAGLALSRSVHQCARAMVARRRDGDRPHDNVLLQNIRFIDRPAAS